MRIRNLIPASVATLLGTWATIATATTYYVSPTGSSANSGSLAAPWSLAKANQSLAGGDVAILLPGNYGSATIAPVNSGSSYSRFVAFVGDLSNPWSTIVAGATFGSRSYVSVKGVRINGGVNLSGPNDSLAWCSSAGSLNGQLGADDCVVAFCTFTGGGMGISGGPNGPGPTFLQRDTLYQSTFNITHGGGGVALRISTTNKLRVDRCRFFITVTPTGNNGTIKMYGVRNSRFIDCRFDVQNQRPTGAGCDECGTSYFRDYFMFNHFVRDTFILHGPQYLDMMVSASGSYAKTTRGNKWDACVFRQDAPGVAAVVYWQDGARADTMLNCAIVSRGLQPINMIAFDDSCLVKNNTFVQMASSGRATDANNWSGVNWVYNNIFYAAPGGVTGSNGGAAINVGNAASWVGNNNLYFCSNPISSSIYIGATASGPGASRSFCTGYGEECASRYGNPLFVGGAAVMSFDPHLLVNSPAIGAGLGGVDIGALPFGGGIDLTPPAPVTDLAASMVSDTRVELAWTAPGDDGGSGQATRYELRMSSQPITALNFDAATPVPGVSQPQVAGVPERVAVEGLSAGGPYYFALKAIDEASNASLISNVLSVQTLTTDTVAPGQVQDLGKSP